MYFPITGYDTLEKLSKNWNIKKNWKFKVTNLCVIPHVGPKNLGKVPSFQKVVRE